MDIFNKCDVSMGPLGKYSGQAEGYFMFPKLEGEISNYMMFEGKKKLVWSLNNYLGLGNHPEVRKVDADAAKAKSLVAALDGVDIEEVIANASSVAVAAPAAGAAPAAAGGSEAAPAAEEKKEAPPEVDASAGLGSLF